MLNTDLKILAKILADYLQTVLPSLTGPGQYCTVKSWTIQESFHLVRVIIEKVDGNNALIISDQSKAFVRVDPGFLKTVFFVIGFGLNFRSWIRFLYGTF